MCAGIATSAIWSKVNTPADSESIQVEMVGVVDMAKALECNWSPGIKNAWEQYKDNRVIVTSQLHFKNKKKKKTKKKKRQKTHHLYNHVVRNSASIAYKAARHLLQCLHILVNLYTNLLIGL